MVKKLAIVSLFLLACDPPAPPPVPKPTPLSAAASASGSTAPATSGAAKPTVSASKPVDKDPGAAPRKLRAGEQASIERGFPLTARLDFAQSFVVQLKDLGECSFITEEVLAVDSDQAGAGSEKRAATPPVATTAPTAVASIAPIPQPKRVEASGYRFHLLCKGDTKLTLPANGEIVNSWTPDGLKAVSFPDLDGDGYADVMVIAEYMTGIGPDGAKPFPVASIYRNKKDHFELDAKLSAAATTKQIATISELRKFASGQ